MDDAPAATGRDRKQDFEDWRGRRILLEADAYKSTSRGRVPFRFWWNFRPVLEFLVPLLRVTGVYGRGLSNALDIRINHIPISLSGLPAAFDGYRILQISDTHLELLPPLADKMTALVRGLEVDLLVLSGDYRDGHVNPPELGLDLLRPVTDAINAKDGKFAILGNHDPATAVDVLQAMGFHVLLNQTVTLQREEAVIHLTGLDDVHQFFTETARAALQAELSGTRIAAVHSPEVADLAAAADIDLYICGHTHGGQICTPSGRPIITRLLRFRQYARGLWQHGEMIGYTTTGAGVASIPVRFNCPPELALFTLRRTD